MKKLIPAVLCAVILFTACGKHAVQDSSSDISNSQGENSISHSAVSETVTSQITPTPSQTPPPVKHYVLASSPDGKYSVCDIGGYESDYFILNNETGHTTEIGTFWSGAQVDFISDTQFVFQLNDYCIYNVSGSVEYRLSDYFPMGITDDGKDIVLFSIYHKDDGGKLILFTDRSKTVTPEKWYNSGTLNEAHLYSVAVMSPDNIVEKIIDTKKHVESSKSRYCAPYMKLTDENTLYLYTDYWNGENTVTGYEITVNLSTGESIIVDYRPIYDPQ